MKITVFIPASACRSTGSITRVVGLLEGLRHHLGLVREQKVVVCDGYGDVREKLGRVGRAREITRADYAEFQRQLGEYCQEHHDCKLVAMADNNGLSANTLYAMNVIVRTPMVLNVQHDFQFVRTIDLRPPVQEMLRPGSPVKHLRFNKRANRPMRWDRVLVPAELPFPALKTNCWSDNPHLMTRRHFKMVIEPLLRRQPVGFPEEALRPVIEGMSFEEAQGRFGTYVYGEPDDPPVVSHA